MRCGHPAVQGEAAKLLGEAADLASVGQHDLALRRVQQAVKAEPGSWVPRVRLAAIYEGRADAGEAALRALAERELAEALRLSPEEMEVHTAVIASRIRRSGITAVRAEYEARRGTLGVAEECLRIIDSLEASKDIAGKVAVVMGPSIYRVRMFGISAVVTAVGFVLAAIGLFVRFFREGPSRIFSSPEFYICVLLFASTGILAMEFFRAKGILKK